MEQQRIEHQRLLEEKIDKALQQRSADAPSLPPTVWVTTNQTLNSSSSSMMIRLSAPATKSLEVTNPPSFLDSFFSPNLITSLPQFPVTFIQPQFRPQTMPHSPPQRQSNNDQ
ncbi:hypothetical protein NE237_022907 [Protea cynaroides]|uniref:Uncharacterized protein n=1 Tax=Protea cynaroides TaxID=273540 RepID=A0A9Q0HB96_9MAGN|nr:hypothetical protein NE237_022907 [Protea cynaroides]